MPIHETEDGKWQFGTTGKKYDSRAKAMKQGLAIVYSQAKKQGKETPSRELIQREVFGKSHINKKAADYYAPEDPITEKDAIYEPSPFWTQVVSGLNADSDPTLLRSRTEVRNAMRPYAMPYTTAEGKRTLRFALDPDIPAMSGAREAEARLRLANTPEHRGKVAESELSDNLSTVEAGWQDLTQERRIALRLAKGKIDAETLKVLGPSYLGFGLAGMLLGRMLAGKKKKWWGYGLGAAAGLGLNFLRRKYAYRGNILV